VALDEHFTGIQDVVTGEEFSGSELLNAAGKKTGKNGFALTVKPHSYRVFKAK
jgi:hypothetical protein